VALGAIQRYGPTHRYYQCHTAHTASSTLTPVATGGNERWGLLAPFARYLDKDVAHNAGDSVLGDVFDLKTGNPLVTTDYERLPWEERRNRIYARGSDADARCWVEFRQPPPRLFGAAYDAAAAYAVGDQVYWDDDGSLTGNWYACLEAAAAGENPSDDAALWQLVEVPLFLEAYLIWKAYALALVGEEQDERRAMAEATAEHYLSSEADVVYRQQGQTPPWPQRTY